eukprot:15437308-Alexandrium_andersonii.AAC.1
MSATVMPNTSFGHAQSKLCSAHYSTARRGAWPDLSRSMSGGDRHHNTPRIRQSQTQQWT